MSGDPTLGLACAYGGAAASARSRVVPEDFQVEEISAVRPTGLGEHLLVKVRKRGANTEWVARSLAQCAGVKTRDIGFAGLKDRHAVTEQWFSIHLPGRDIDSRELDGDDYQILESVRHGRKIRRGALRGNRFRIVLRDVCGDRDSLLGVLRRLANEGAPNYFGSQRFGRNGANLSLAGGGRKLPGMRLSAFRAHLFNNVLCARLRAGTWNQVMLGDCLLLDGTQRYFPVEVVDSELRERVAIMDVHPTGPLWGKGELPTSSDVATHERDIVDGLADYAGHLERHGLKQERRALRMRIKDLEWEWNDPDKLVLSFVLPRGSYATAVLRELITAPAAEG